jgi:MFS family permease
VSFGDLVSDAYLKPDSVNTAVHPAFVTPQPSGRQSRLSPVLVGLLAAAMLLNYADRGSLSIAAPVLKDAFVIDNTAMGLLFSAFFWSYALAQPIAGWVTQRFPPRTVLAAGVGLWSLATIVCGMAISLPMLLAMRLLLGIGESVIFPINACIFSQAADHERGRANGATAVGSYLGPSLGTFAGGVILALLGWRAVFWVLGGVSLLWIIPWLATSRRLLGRCAEPHPHPAPYREILRQRGLWGASLGQFCYSCQFYLILTWLPLYLVKAQHFSLAKMTAVGVALYLCQALSAALTGFSSDLLIARGLSSTLVRKTFLITGLAGTGTCLALIGVWPAAAVPLLVLSGATTGLSGPTIFSTGQSLAGPRAGGRWMGIQNMLGNLAGIIAPVVTGIVVDRTGSFAAAFVLAGAMSLIGIASWLFVVRDIREVSWRPAPAAAAAAPA